MPGVRPVAASGFLRDMTDDWPADRTLDVLRAAHARLLARLDGLGDEDVRRPSRLPGWTVGHVLSHLARNADSVVRRFDGVQRGAVVDQYEGGPEGRAAGIEAGAHRPAAELVLDVRRSAEAAEVAAAAIPADRWDAPTRSVSGAVEPAIAVLRGRVVEVEVHHVDLGLGYEPSDWPPDFVALGLADKLPDLPGLAADPGALLAWIIGRSAEPPVLRAWE